MAYSVNNISLGIFGEMIKSLHYLKDRFEVIGNIYENPELLEK